MNMRIVRPTPKQPNTRRVTVELEAGRPTPAQVAAWQELVAWLLSPLDGEDTARDTLGNIAEEESA